MRGCFGQSVKKFLRGSSRELIKGKEERDRNGVAVLWTRGGQRRESMVRVVKEILERAVTSQELGGGGGGP